MRELGVFDLSILHLELDRIDSYPELERSSDNEMWVSTPGRD